MKKMRVAALALAFIFTLSMLSLAGCGNPETPPAPAAAAAPAPAAPAEVPLEEVPPEEVPPEEVIEITMVYLISGRESPPGVPEVFEAINAITGPEIGVHVTPMIFEWGMYAQQVGLMLTAREPIDLLITTPSGATSFSVAAPQGHFMAIDDLLQEYGQDILRILGPLATGTMLGGETLGVTGWRSMVQNVYVAMRKDTLIELDILEQAQNVTSMDDLTEIFAIVAENTSLVPVVAAADANILSFGGYVFANEFANWSAFDTLGCTLQLIRSTPDGRVLNVYETPEFRQSIEQVRYWYERGFVYRDLAIATEHAANYIRNDVGFAYFLGTEAGGTISHQNIAGTELLFVPVTSGPQVGTGQTRSFVWTIPSASREPEAAMRFLNMMFTDRRIMTLITYGIEGRDFIVRPDGMAQFPEGLDQASVPYHFSNFLFGNQFLLYPWYGTSPDLRIRAEADMERIGASQFLGFSADLSEVQHEVAAVQGVLDQFRRQLVAGSAPMTVFDEFVERLQQVGANDIVAEYQRQLDEWLANR